MELKIFKVRVYEDDSYYVFAFSWEHALVIVAELLKEYPDEFTKSDIEQLTLDEADEIEIEYNYVTDKYKTGTLKDYFKKVEKSLKPVYAVITDDFVEY